ncbi:YciI family protein [Actinokineospora sp. HUAS TT18]|uniref:YciI family protein n=1 Tax=Actinokineospora sp. HUAS TT18 TaxID=3447451 RepID=UPI003F51B62C
MKFMLLMNYHVDGVEPITEWAPEDIKAHMEFQHSFGKKLTDSGELVDAQGLAWPDAAKKVVKKDGPAVVTDGPFAEAKEFLAGYWTVDVESLERAVEIAAEASAAPGPQGRPLGQEILVREVMSAPPAEQ